MKIREYKKGKRIRVSDKMQTFYEYTLSQNYGDMKDHPEFQPELRPDQMLVMGVFEGKYLNDCVRELPEEWYTRALRAKTLSLDHHPHVEMNYFKVKSRQPLSEWKRKGWIYGNDVRGWFQWYCRFFLGRRDPIIDQKQIRRWRSFQRHKAQIVAHCPKKNMTCRPRQRQALLQWAYDPRF